MGFHSDTVNGPEQDVFRGQIDHLRKKYRMSWGMLFEQADLSQKLKGRFDDTHSRIQILQDAYKRKAIRPISNAIRELYERKLLEPEPEKMVRGPQGTRLSQADSNRIRRLIKTARQRGHLLVDLAKQSGTHPTWITTFVNTPDARMMSASAEKLLPVLKSMLPQALIDEAFGTVTMAALIDESLGTVTIPTPNGPAPQEDQHLAIAKAADVDVFTMARLEIEATLRKLEGYIKPFPKDARRAIEVSVIDRLRLAIEGLSSDEGEPK